jgi:hypothetical protein
VLFNHLLHAAVGVLASQIFSWSVSGALTAVFISAGIQGIDTFRIRRQVVAMSMGNPEPIRSEQLEAIRGPTGTYKLVQLFVYKAIWYALITLVAAHVTRGWTS